MVVDPSSIWLASQGHIVFVREESQSSKNNSTLIMIIKRPLYYVLCSTVGWFGLLVFRVGQKSDFKQNGPNSGLNNMMTAHFFSCTLNITWFKVAMLSANFNFATFLIHYVYSLLFLPSFRAQDEVNRHYSRIRSK